MYCSVIHELGRHRGREGKLECTLCGAECENVVNLVILQYRGLFKPDGQVGGGSLHVPLL